jgi:hypothetical protein
LPGCKVRVDVELISPPPSIFPRLSIHHFIAINPLLCLPQTLDPNQSNFKNREMLRQHRRVGLLAQHDALLETVFDLGALPSAGVGEGEALARAEMERKLEEERARYGDLFRLEMEENMDEG